MNYRYLCTVMGLSLLLLMNNKVSAQESMENAPAEATETQLQMPLLEEKIEVYVEGQVIQLSEETIVMNQDDPDFNVSKDGEQKKVTQMLKVKILADGAYKNHIFTTENVIAGRAKDIYLTSGEKVLVHIAKGVTTGKITADVIDYYRTPVVWFMIIAFLVALIAFGGKKGVAAVAGLAMTFGVIFFVFIPYIMQGGNPLWLSIGASILITFLVHLFVGGLSAKSLSSTAGTAGGMLVAGLFASFAASVAHLNGLASEDAMNLFLKNPNLDFDGIFMAAIIIGSLGAVMDIGISISSAISEVKAHAPHATFKQLFAAGMNIGKDTLGTMTNTLILAYAGSALPLMIFIVMNSTSFGVAIGYDFIAEEIMKSIAGSFGLLVTIPITAYISAWLESRKQQ